MEEQDGPAAPLHDEGHAAGPDDLCHAVGKGPGGGPGQAQSQCGQTSRAEHKSHVCIVIEVFVPTSKIPRGLHLPGLFLMSGWTVWKEVLMNISTEKDAGHIYGGRRWVQRQMEHPSHQKEGERWVWLLL